MDRLQELFLRHTLYVPTVGELNDPNDSRPLVRRLNHREIVRFLVRTRVKEKPESAGFVPELTGRMTELCATVDWTLSSGSTTPATRGLVHVLSTIAIM